MPDICGRGAVERGQVLSSCVVATRVITMRDARPDPLLLFDRHDYERRRRPVEFKKLMTTGV